MIELVVSDLHLGTGLRAPILDLGIGLDIEAGHSGIDFRFGYWV